MIPKYFCETCGFKRIFEVSRYNQFIGYGTLVTIRCKACGKEVKNSKDLIESFLKNGLRRESNE